MAQQGTKPAYADYEPVADRISAFYEKHSDGRIITVIIEHDQERGFILMRAEVYRNPDDAQPASTGHAYELKSEGYVNRTSYIENCETGCIGRALANLNFKTKKGIASREEMEKVERMQERQPTPLRSPAAPDEQCEQIARKPSPPTQGESTVIIQSQIYAITNIGKTKKIDVHAYAMEKYGKPVTALSGEQAAEMIRYLNGVKA